MRFLLALSLLIFINCKKSKPEEALVFELTANRNVSIKIDPQVHYALEDLSNINPRYETKCNNILFKIYSIEFYFEINEVTQELIIIESFFNPCESGDWNVNKFTAKYSIPIAKIKSVDIEDFTTHYINGDPEYYKTLFINMDYNAKAISKEYMESRGVDDKQKYVHNTIQEKVIILEAENQTCIKIKNDIEMLVKRFKI